MPSNAPKNLAELLRLRVEASGESEAIVFQKTRLTWNNLWARAARISQRLSHLGIGRGQIVGILAPHSPAQVAALFGIALTDATFSIINPLLQPAQIEHQVTDAAMGAVVGCRQFHQHLEGPLDRLGLPWLEVDLEGLLADGEPVDGPLPTLSATANIPTDVANIIYTSGSTGRPKGVVVPHRTLLDGARIVSGYLGITADDRTLSILPLGFDYGLNQLLTAVYTGATVVMHGYVMPLDLLRTLERERITGMAAVPSIWPGLLAQMKRLRRELQLESLRYITTAGGAHSPQLLRQLDDGFADTDIIIMYGLTESFRSTYLPYRELHGRPSCVGRAVPEVELLVLDEDGRLAAHGKGELVHRGAFVTYGYLNNPEMTAQRFIDLPPLGPGCVAEKAVRSGDLVTLGEDGFVTFHGRLDAQIKSRGHRVSPDEVAEAVMAVEGVRLAAVFGLPDEVLGQRIVTAYETHSGEALPEPTLLKHLSTALPSYAVPKTFHFFPKLPSTANGKLDITGMRRECAALEISV